MLFQEVEEAQPFRRIDVRLALLLHVAARRVDQNRVLGEKPVAVARAANPLQVVGEVDRKVQAGLAQGRGLAGGRRPDDHVPRHLAQELASAQLAALQFDHHLGELGADGGDVLFAGAQRFFHHGRSDFGDEHAVGPDRPALRDDQPDQPEDDQQRNDDDADIFRGEGFVSTDPDDRAEHPDNQRKQRDADQRPQPARCQNRPEEAQDEHLTASFRPAPRRGGSRPVPRGCCRRPLDR